MQRALLVPSTSSGQASGTPANAQLASISVAPLYHLRGAAGYRARRPYSAPRRARPASRSRSAEARSQGGSFFHDVEENVAIDQERASILAPLRILTPRHRHDLVRRQIQLAMAVPRKRSTSDWPRELRDRVSASARINHTLPSSYVLIVELHLAVRPDTGQLADILRDRDLPFHRDAHNSRLSSITLYGKNHSGRALGRQSAAYADGRRSPCGARLCCKRRDRF